MDTTPTIVIAEDEPGMLMLLEQCLKNHGYTIYTASDGREALQLIEQQSPDLILTDIMMPFTSGLDLIGIVRSSTQFTHIPIIVLSAIEEESTVMQAFHLGADDFVTKPFAPNELSIRVRRLLANYRHSSEPAAFA
ncbi:response regulator [Deminuibacter soli]|uniref:Response regulator n=2 Tax=Deminuibacter soli TaxID=2291815 RepID=A0A3E1NRQ0_9BACT|nr:response regulator [Deminuibacter soli]